MDPSVIRYFHPVLAARGLGGGPVRVELAGRPYVLFRDAEGRPGALDDLCPHRRAPLSRGRVRPDGRLACPYHGWHFDADGRGRSPTSPEATHCDTRAHRIAEHRGFLWLASRETPRSSLPELSWPGFRFVGSVSTRFPAGLELTLDNICESEHFAFLHSTFGWSAEGAREARVETRKHADRSEVDYTGPQRPSPLAWLGGLRAGDRFHTSWCTRFEPVHTVYTFGWRHPGTGRPRPVTTRTAVYLTPERADSTWAHMFIFLRIAPSIQRLVHPLMGLLARSIAARELRRDAWIAGHLQGTPTALKGMRLTRHDRALAYNRRLLRRLYWRDGTGAVPPPAGTEPGREGR